MKVYAYSAVRLKSTAGALTRPRCSQAAQMDAAHSG